MKKIVLYTIMATLILGIGACKKIENQAPSKVVKVTYPGLILKGDEAVTVNVGGTYTDAGATLTDDITGAVSDVEGDVSGIDLSTEGLYFVTFTAANANGYETTITRPVAVTDVPDAFDISGEYLCAARGGTANLIKVSRGLFKTDNLNGGVTALGSIYMMVKSDLTIDIPVQYTTDGGFTGNYVDEELTLSPDTNYVYAINASGFGTAPRLFEKQ
jgi:hypothetical protein